MNLFRRLFSQPEQKTEPTPPASGANVKTRSEGDETMIANDTITDTPTLHSSDMTFSSVVDGATRPLPQDTFAVSPNGNDHLIFGQATDVGMVRTNNQDAALSFFATARSVEEQPDFGLFIVADGMGGHHDGEKASAITTRTLAAEITTALYLPLLSSESDAHQVPISETLEEAVRRANSDVLTHVPDGGTTLTAVTVIGDLAYIAHVGDSRIYLLQGERIEQITRDHSLVQRLKELGQLTDAEMADHPQKNVLYRALGQGDALEVDTMTRRLPPNSRLLLCSDGLWNQVEEREIVDVITKHQNPQEACEKLVELANARGGIDNVTAILLQIPG